MVRSQAMFRIATSVALLCLCLGAAHGAETPAEVRVKAAVVHKIAKFVTWPQSAFAAPDSPLRFCVVGDGMIFDALSRMSDRPIHGRNVTVRRVLDPSAAAGECDVMYLTNDIERPATAWLGEVADRPVLTFGDAESYGGSESIVMLTIRRNKVRFAINLEANSGTGLSISAQLLQLAASVGGGS